MKEKSQINSDSAPSQNPDNAFRIVRGGTSNRIGYIDALKGLAIICVVFGHVADGYLEAHIYPESEVFLNGVYNIIYTFHMPLFMIISGFVFCTAYVHDDVPDKKRIHKQVLNLISIYILFSILFGLFKVVVGKYTNNPISMYDILLILIKPIYPYWYLYILIFLYLIFSIDYLKKINRYILLLVFAVLALVSQLFSFPYFEINKLLYYSFFFYIGMVLKSTDAKVVKRKLPIFILFCTSVVLCILLWNPEKYINGYFGTSIVVALGISLMLLWLFYNVDFLGNNRFLQLIGRYCLEIYVIHCVFTAGLRTVFLKIGIENVYLSFVLNGVISTAIPIVFSIICQKLKIHGLLFKPVTYISNFINKRKKDKI